MAVRSNRRLKRYWNLAGYRFGTPIFTPSLAHHVSLLRNLASQAKS